MRAVIYEDKGDASVLRVVDRAVAEPAEGEVRVRVAVSGVNPTDWKTRSGAFGGSPGEPTVPNHDGAGIVNAVVAGGAGARYWDRIADAAADLNLAIEDGALRVGDEAGLPHHRFDLDDTAGAHEAVERGAVGKVLVTVAA